MFIDSPLGRTTSYAATYDPSLLYPIPRARAREAIGVKEPIPFDGADLWTAYELSWLTPSGKPMLAIGELSFPCTSPAIVESKSVKLYLNSYSQTSFASPQEVTNTLIRDLSLATGAPTGVQLTLPQHFDTHKIDCWSGICLDDLDTSIDTYQRTPDFLIGSASGPAVSETLYTYLFKAHCLVTGQPDWGGIFISYRGKQVSHPALLKYLISYRNHSGIAEQCVEQIFTDLWHHWQPEALTVYGRFTRRGGIDINPFRSTFEKAPSNRRLAFQ